MSNGGAVPNLQSSIPTPVAMLFQVNTSVDNIGARRLHTVLERIVEDISFDAPEKVGQNAVPSICGSVSLDGIFIPDLDEMDSCTTPFAMCG